MSTWRVLVGPATTLALLHLASLAHAQGGDAPTAPEPSPDTITVVKRPFRIDLALDGVFTADEMTEVVVRPESWSDLTVLSAVPHGGLVQKGDVILSLETRKIDEAIADLEAEQATAELAVNQAAEELRLLEKTVPIDLAAAERAAANAAEDLKRFNELDRPLALRAAQTGLKLAGEFLEYQQEELRQLEKMYKADDITEETEEIVLKRARNDMEHARFAFEQSQAQYDQTVKVTLPRKQLDVERAARTTAVELEKTRATLPITLRQKQLALLKLRQDLAKSADKLNKLRQDRRGMTVTAAAAGVIYHGRCQNGKWSGGAEASETLRPGGKISAAAVLMTLVAPGKLHVRAVIPEKHFGDARPGQPARIAPTAFAGVVLSGQLRSMESVPAGTGFDAIFAVAPAAVKLAAGMTAKVTIRCYDRPEAIALPAAAVHTDDADDQRHYVWIVPADAKPVRRDVTIGRKSDDKVEITSGLAPGDKVVAKGSS